MATAEQDMAALENQLEKALKLAENLNKSTEAIIERGEQRKIIRQMKNLTEKTEKIHEIKELLRDAKFTADEDEEETEQAIKEIDERAEVFENAIDELDFKLAKIQAEAKRKAREEEMALERAYEQEKMDREYRQREKEEKERLRRQAEHEDEQLEKRLKKMEQQQDQVKLPKLVISKFNGTYLDWLRFWEQFRSQIDESAIADGAKLTYLQELLEEKRKQEILGLPFSSEGYQQAKEILERKYGIDSEIINAHVTQIFSLPAVMRHDVIKIHDFYQKLNLSVQSLKTLKKLSTVEGLVRMTLDKLECIKSDLIRTDDNWRSWDFPELVEALREWTFRSPIKTTEEASKSKLGEDRKPSRFRKERGFQTQTKKPRSCVYCEKDDHRSSDCTKLKSIEERKSHLVKNKLCYNCTGNRHTAAKCKSSVSCQVCNGRHHTSICEKRKENLLAATMAGQVIHPMVLVDVDGIRCRAILDTAASTSYASSSLVNALKKKMLRKEAREIEMMLGTKKTVFEVYAAELKAVDGDFSMTTEITKLDKPVVTEVPNPDFVGILRKYAHLKGVNIADMSQKEQLPIHLILVATIAEHLKQYEEKQFEVVQEIRDSLYVDDIISGGDEISNLHDMKSQMINIFKDGGFQLHKWHSNAAELEDCMSSNEAQTYADESLGARNTETSILGLKWNKKQDLISVNFLPAKETAETTKRGILRGMARIYDPLGIVAPVLLKAKTLYRQACEDNLPWDKQLPESLAKQWIKWQRQLPESISVPRCVSMKTVKDIQLHGFGDASKDGCCVTIYVVASDGVETTQGLLSSKVRVAKKNLTIPRLELISGHMVANMLDNTRNILKRYPVT